MARVGALKTRFPYQFRGLFRLEINTGWFPLIEVLSADLDALLTEEERATFTFSQIKEKLAGLRAYWKDLALEYTIEDNGTLLPLCARDYVLSRLRPLSASMRDAIQARIETAERAAETICERCGEPGEVRELGGYLSVRCERHVRTSNRA